MRLGDCFVERTRHHDDHLFIVAFDPDKNPDAVLLLSVTTLRGKKESVCVFNANEHAWIRHTSCIACDFARTVSKDVLETARVAGLLQMFPPFPDHLLRRIWAGAAASTKLDDQFADLLIEQGFLDI